MREGSKVLKIYLDMAAGLCQNQFSAQMGLISVSERSVFPSGRLRIFDPPILQGREILREQTQTVDAPVL